MVKSIFDRVNMSFFSRLLDASALEQKLVAENIVNADNPAYKAKRVDFASVLSQTQEASSGRLLRTHERHIEGSMEENDGLKVDRDENPIIKTFENNVDVDKEMVKSAKNQLYYMTLSKIVGGKFRALHTTIKGRV